MWAWCPPVWKCSHGRATVIIEQQAGTGSGIADEEYVRVGAQMMSQAEVWQARS